MPDDRSKDESLNALVRLVAELAIEEEQKEAPPEEVPTRPRYRERLNVDESKTKSH